MANTPYQNLEIITAEIKRQAEAGEWETAAQIAAQLGAQLQKTGLPTATSRDKEAIEAALTIIAEITDRAAPLQADIGQLLKAFGTPATPA